jgi:predicted nucleotide-binding protein
VSQDRTPIFVTHGHAELSLLRVKAFLERLGLAPIVLQDEDDRGLTVIEKFEYYARPCEAAVIIMTPDDLVVFPGTSDVVSVSRPNVLIELGWFIRHVGRARVLILFQESVSVPSNIGGVVTLRFRDDPLEVTERIRQRLEGLGLI